MIKQHQCRCGENNPANFYKGNKSKCKACISVKNHSRYHSLDSDAKKAYRDYQKQWQNANMYQYRLISARNRAYKKNMEFDITVDYLKELYEAQGGKCYYSGIEFDNTDENYSMSVDRVDSTKGYTKGNVVLAASIINTMKNNLSVTDFMTVVQRIVDYQATLDKS